VAYSGKITDKNGATIKMPADNSEASDLLIEFWLSAQKDGWGFRWAVLFENKFVGIVGFNSLKENYEIAFHLLPSHWGNGIMIDAAMAAVVWAQKNGANGIEAYIEIKNARSVSLARKLEMHATEKSSKGAQHYLVKF
jgi:RimJ/RimL family protein N-acetyltransferase